MDAFLVICQGIGLATAAGVRPFLPALLAGALAGADSGLDFDGTDFAFLEQPVWLIAVVAALAAVVGYERRRPEAFEAGPLGAALAGMSIGVGALLFGASLADEGHPAWAGLVAGIPCAALANASARNFFARVGIAGLAILVPPVSLVVLAGLAVLLLRGRRRDDEKYAGLRSLR
jgi:hypothetical protein